VSQYRIKKKMLAKPSELLKALGIHKTTAATPGTAAHDYISGKLDMGKVEEDSRLVLTIPQADGALLCFKDGASVLRLQPELVGKEGQA